MRSRSPNGDCAPVRLRPRDPSAGVYTPQVIVNGRVEGTGLDANELASLMRSAERGDSGPNVDIAGGAVTVGAAAAHGGGHPAPARPATT
jgi:hypothetical protein